VSLICSPWIDPLYAPGVYARVGVSMCGVRAVCVHTCVCCECMGRVFLCDGTHMCDVCMCMWCV
jgi:hypothetical protein